ncbi:MAG: DedA family protein [Thermoguttaceae bacterium]|jgi:membrane-associated protein
MLETLKELILRYVVHLDKSLENIIQMYGAWTYSILFVVIFCETGLVVTPFLPGDSLLFAAGTFAGLGSLDASVLFVFLAMAAVLGDTVNYWIGAAIGPRAFSSQSRFFRKEYLDRTHRFFERHGGKTIIIARFVPIIRTFAPFVAGIGAMNYRRFIAYNVVGGVAWVGLFLGAGYWFGSQEWVRNRFHYVIAAIILISVMPILIEYLRARRRKEPQGK